MIACLFDTLIGVGDGRNVLRRGDEPPKGPPLPPPLPVANLPGGVAKGFLPEDRLGFVFVFAGGENAVLLAPTPSSTDCNAGNGEGDGKGEDVKAAVARAEPLAVREPGAEDLWGVDCEDAGRAECGFSDSNTPAMSVSSTFMSLNLRTHIM